MHLKPHAFLLAAGMLIISTLACTFSVETPNLTPTPLVQVNTEVATASTLIPSATPNTVPANTQIPTNIPPTLNPPTQIPNSCSANWFFTFDTQHQTLGSFCPMQVKILEAIGQDFEGGRVYRYAPDPDYPQDQRGTIYIIYNDGEWITAPDTWDASQPSSDPSLIPPANRFQPVDAIGKAWREVPDVRSRLGWAYESQAAFQGQFQTYAPYSTADTHYSFIYHGKWGLVLLLNSVDMGPNKWEVAGTYP